MASSEGRGYYDMTIDWDGAVGLASQTGRVYGCLYSAGKYLVRLGRKTSTSSGMIEDLEKVADFLERAVYGLGQVAVNSRYVPEPEKEVPCQSPDDCVASILQAIQQVGIDRTVAMARIQGCISWVDSEIAGRKAELR